MSRPDVFADTIMLQIPIHELTVSDLKEVNRTLKYLKATADTYIVANKFDWQDFALVPYGDVSFANAPGTKSQGALMTEGTLKDASTASTLAFVSEWKSHGMKRTLRSTLAAEATSQDTPVDDADFLECVLSERFDPDYKVAAACGGESLIPIIPATDCRSSYDAVHRLATSFSEKRTEIDCLRQTAKRLRWISNTQQ